MRFKYPEVTTRVTVLCDCTEDFDLHRPGLRSDEAPNVDKVVVTNYSPIAAQQNMYDLFHQISESSESYLVILGNMQEVMALCVILANSLIDKPLEDVPHLPVKDVVVWEVFDNENILLSTSEGRVIQSSYDSALRPLVSDYQMIQVRAIKDDPEAESNGVIQYVESDISIEKVDSVQELISKRKSKSKHGVSE